MPGAQQEPIDREERGNTWETPTGGGGQNRFCQGRVAQGSGCGSLRKRRREQSYNPEIPSTEGGSGLQSAFNALKVSYPLAPLAFLVHFS